MSKKLKIIFVAGARPNFMKIAPMVAEAKKYNHFQNILVHTGQHYDKKMSCVFFDELKIPKPDINLGIGSGNHAQQTGKIMIKFDAVLEKLQPDLVIVVGDVNSTIACSLAAKKRGVKVAHVEAGLRSFDWTMPEEINRVLTDRISDFLFCTEKSAVENLKTEGISAKKIFFVGNVMIDTLLAQKRRAEKSKILQKLGLAGKKYALTTLHRPSNVDDKKMLKKIIKILGKISAKMPVIFPIHPRTEKNLKKWRIKSGSGIRLIKPVGYLDFLKLMTRASVVLTDSGGIQEETTILGVPCLTLRQNTERPVTVSEGTNKIVGASEEKIVKYVSAILKNKSFFKYRKQPKLWDGRAAQRIIKIITRNFKSQRSTI
ncbi:UDP-N-acetylglucosamine 2-epimerase (non-hydrolyzing) [Candidatus Peregrinibacteria bacterium]|nr:UDP-N-acetylglucosamine 2-epimerase (non-hydrolyzing) [Candidatus Peregrinibacteria bacterium]